MTWEHAYNRIQLIFWIILLSITSLSYIFINPVISISILLGGFVIILNFSCLQHTVRKTFSKDDKFKRGPIIIKYYLRLIGLGIIIFYLLSQGWINAIGLAIGLSTVVISIVVFGISLIWKNFISEAH